MTQTTNRFFDEIARLMNDAAGVAQGVKREADSLFRNQAERILRDLDVVKREEFEAVKEMARLAREENEALKARIAALDVLVPDGEGAEVEREYLVRAGVRGARIAPLPAPPFPHAAHFCFAAPRAVAAGAWRALARIRAVLGLGDG